MAFRETEEALLYLSYVIRRSVETAEEIREAVGPVAVAMEARYQAELLQAKAAYSREVH